MKNHFVSMTAFLVSLAVSPALQADVLPDVSPRHAVVANQNKRPPFVGDRFARTELYFGTARSDNQPPVSEAEFQSFLDNNITPAFPDGLTVAERLGAVSRCQRRRHRGGLLPRDSPLPRGSAAGEQREDRADS